MEHGLKAEYYTSSEGNADFNELRNITIDSPINFPDLNPRLSENAGRTDQVSVRWSGQFQPEFTDDYTFYMIGDNGFRLWVDHQLAIDYWVDDWDQEQTAVPIRLHAGQKYDIKIEYFNGNGGANLKLYWSSPSVAKAIVPSHFFYYPAELYQAAYVTGFAVHAQGFLDASVIGNEPGQYRQVDADQLQVAIESAKVMATQPDVTSDRLEQAFMALRTELDRFRSKVNKIPWDTPGGGNPVMPGYFADPTMFYDEASDTFFSYATMDGIDYNWQRDPHVAYSKDMVSWEYVPLKLPSFWPTPSDTQPLGHAIWAPSIVNNSGNGKYYLTYSIDMSTYIAYSDSPFGPWTNATKGTTAETAPLLQNGKVWGGADAFDGQLFVDTDGKVYMVVGGGGNSGIVALKFNADHTVSVDNNAPGMTDGHIYKHKRITGLAEYNEGPALFTKDGKYYLFYSVEGSQKYRLRYATAPSLLGPYTSQPEYVVKRDEMKNILGPGHASIIEYGGDIYLGYHRQHFPFVDSKRQVAINKLMIDGDSVSLNIQNHAGLRSGDGALERLVAQALQNREQDFAYLKTAIASSVSDYKGGTFSGERFEGISQFYKADYAVDDNNGTRWMAGVEQDNFSYWIVDLGADYDIGRTETTFEYVTRTYNYKIASLEASEASDIYAAEKSDKWKLYADRTSNEQKQSPVVNFKRATARYLKVTIVSANLPTDQETRNPGSTDYINRVSIVAFKVFGNTEETLRKAIARVQAINGG